MSRPGKVTVYVETTVISYLTARPSRDVVVAGHQQITQEWWQTRRERFELFASQAVVQEAAAGDPEAARERLRILETMSLWEVSEDALALARQLIAQGIVPPKVAEDALHLAIAVTHGAEYLLTWNCKHLANAMLRKKIERFCRSQGYEPTTICTPEELFEV